MAVNDIYRVTANYTNSDGDLRNWVWHYRQTSEGSPSTSDIIDAIVAILLIIWNLLRDYINAGTTGQSVELALYDDVVGEFNTLEVRDITDQVGNFPSAYSSGNVAPYVSFFTAVARSRGKKFLFDIGRDYVADNRVDALLLAAMTLAAVQWAQTFTVDGVTFRPGNFNPDTGQYRGWKDDAVGVGLFAGSQYRRLVGRGV